MKYFINTQSPQKVPSNMSAHNSGLILQDEKTETRIHYNFIHLFVYSRRISHLHVTDSVIGKVRKMYKEFIV